MEESNNQEKDKKQEQAVDHDARPLLAEAWEDLIFMGSRGSSFDQFSVILIVEATVLSQAQKLIQLKQGRDGIVVALLVIVGACLGDFGSARGSTVFLFLFRECLLKYVYVQTL
jgi:hypothetical protein